MAAIQGAREQRAFGRRGAVPPRSTSVALTSPSNTIEYLPLKARILLTVIAGAGATAITLVYLILVVNASTEPPTLALFGPESRPLVGKMIAQERYHWAPTWAPAIASFIFATLIAWPWLRNRPPLNLGRAMLLSATLIFAAAVATYVTRAIWPIAVIPGVPWVALAQVAITIPMAQANEVFSKSLPPFHVILPLLFLLAGIILMVTREWLETREASVIPAQHSRRIEIIQILVLGLTSIAMGKLLITIAQVHALRPLSPAHTAILAVSGAVIWALASYPRAEFSLRRICMGSAFMAMVLWLCAFVLAGEVAPIPIDLMCRVLGASLAVAWLGRQVRVPLVWMAMRLRV